MNNTKENTTPLVDNSYYEAVTTAIRSEARRVMESGEVSAVIGYKSGRRKGSAQPVIISDVSRIDELVFAPTCTNNLSLYLTKAKKEVSKKGKIAIVAKGCDLKALAGLMSESQLKRENLHLIGISCAGVHGSNVKPSEALSAATIARKCRECTVHVPEGVDCIAGTLPQLEQLSALESAELERLEAMSPAGRWAFWKEQFSRCIRCMACRQVCPFCYCEQCLCDRNRPQGVETTPRPAGNMGWHIVRAMHLAGRCAGCAECERSCPMDIPLNLLNRKMANELKELYGQEAGMQPQEKGPLATYKEDDDESFIK